MSTVPAMRTITQRVEEWLLIHAWVDAERPDELRIRVRRPLSEESADESRIGFTDPDQAVSFIRVWLGEFPRRARLKRQQEQPDERSEQ